MISNKEGGCLSDCDGGALGFALRATSNPRPNHNPPYAPDTNIHPIVQWYFRVGVFVSGGVYDKRMEFTYL